MGKAGVPNTRTKAEREAQREKIVSLRLSGKSYREIAEQFGCTVSNARLVFLKAIKKEENEKLSKDLVYRLKTCRAEYKRIGLIKEAVVEIERLRSQKAITAADEIERLREENAKLKEEVDDLNNRLIEAAEMADYHD